MKKLFFIILAVLFCASTFAKDYEKVKINGLKKSVKVYDNFRTFTKHADYERELRVLKIHLSGSFKYNGGNVDVFDGLVAIEEDAYDSYAYILTEYLINNSKPKAEYSWTLKSYKNQVSMDISLEFVGCEECDDLHIIQVAGARESAGSKISKAFNEMSNSFKNMNNNYNYYY